MKHSALMGFLRFLASIPGAMYCYFVHSWSHWGYVDEEVIRYTYACQKCPRFWGFRRYK